MKKGLLSVILSFAVLFTLIVPASVSADLAAEDTFTVDGFKYKVMSNLTDVQVTTGSTVTGDVVLPATVVYGTQTFNVVNLAYTAFANNKNITSFVMPDTVTTVGMNAFYGCTNMESIHISEAATGLMHGTFFYCSSLTSVTIPANVETLRKTFNYCTALTSVTFKGQTTVPEDAGGVDIFDGCTQGTDAIAVTAYEGSPAATYCQSKGCTMNIISPPSPSDGLYTFADNGDGTITIDGLIPATVLTGDVKIPNVLSSKTVVGIADGVFEGQTEVTKLTIPNTVTAIGKDAFKNMDGLTEVTLPNSVTSIGSGIFKDCDNLETVTLSANLTGTMKETFAYCAKLKGCVVPDGVTALDNTFVGCTAMTSVTIPPSVTSITEETLYTALKAESGVPNTNINMNCESGSEAENYANMYGIPCATPDIDPTVDPNPIPAHPSMPAAWDGTSVDISWYASDKTEFEISTPAQLAGLRQLVNGGTETFAQKTIKLKNDIDMNGKEWKIGIGYSADVAFEGMFDGNYCKIVNFAYNSNTTEETLGAIAENSYKYHGLFGYLSVLGEIKNLGIENAKLEAGTKDVKVDGLAAGCLAGVNEGKITHCYIDGLELSGGFWGSYCTQYYSGIAGVNQKIIEDCFVKNIDFKGVVAQINASRKAGMSANNSTGEIKDCYVLNPIYDSGQGFYQWDDNGNGTSKCPIMFMYDPITLGGVVKNVYSTDLNTRSQWETTRTYEDFHQMTAKMSAEMATLNFETIKKPSIQVAISKTYADKTGVTPKITLGFYKNISADSLNDSTINLKLDDTKVNNIGNVAMYDADGINTTYPNTCVIKFNDDLKWDREYELSVTGVKDLWQRAVEDKVVTFETGNEIYCDSFDLYVNYGTASEAKISSVNQATGPVTAVIKGLKNNGKKVYSAVLSISALSDGQLVSGAAKTVNISANEKKSEDVTITSADISSLGSVQTVQSVLYKAFGAVIPMLDSAKIGE